MSSRAPRAPRFSYIGLHRYFLTICTFRRRPVFFDQDDGRWGIDQLLPIARSEYFAIVAYCVMPDHVHLVVEGESEASNLRSMVHRWKLTTGYAWKQRRSERLWQEGYYDSVLRAEDDLGAVVRYVLNNPVRAGLVAQAEDYTLIRSERYAASCLIEAAGDWSPRRRRDRSPGRV